VNRLDPGGEKQPVLKLLRVPREVGVSLGGCDPPVLTSFVHQLLGMKLTPEVLTNADADVVEIDKKSDFVVWQKVSMPPISREADARMELVGCWPKYMCGAAFLNVGD
jgi:hypothetical protein